MDDGNNRPSRVVAVESPLVDAAEIAELFSVHPSTVRRLAREGRLPSYWIGSSPRFDVEEVAAHLRREAAYESRPRGALRRDVEKPRATQPLERGRLRAELYGRELNT